LGKIAAEAYLLEYHSCAPVFVDLEYSGKFVLPVTTATRHSPDSAAFVLAGQGIVLDCSFSRKHPRTKVVFPLTPWSSFNAVHPRFWQFHRNVVW
jgi:hypothetical protein